MSRVIGMARLVVLVGCVMLVDVEAPFGHHGRAGRFVAVGGGPHLRGLAGLWISRLMARYRREGEAAFETRSRRPHHSPNATPRDTVELVLSLRKHLTEAGHDAGADTIGWHLTHHHQVRVSRATIHRILITHAAVPQSRASGPRVPTSGSRHRSPTKHGNPISPTTGWPTAGTPRS